MVHICSAAAAAAAAMLTAMAVGAATRLRAVAATAAGMVAAPLAAAATDKSDKSDKSDGAAAKGRKAEKGTAWSRFLLGNRTVLGPSVYKKYCESVERDYEVPVQFTAPDGSHVFKVLDVGKYDEKFRWAKNPEQNLAVEGEDYF